MSGAAVVNDVVIVLFFVDLAILVSPWLCPPQPIRSSMLVIDAGCLALVLVLAVITYRTLSLGSGYWVLLTVLFLLKPEYDMTVVLDRPDHRHRARRAARGRLSDRRPCRTDHRRGRRHRHCAWHVS